MTEGRIPDLLDEIAGALVLAEATDLPALAEIHTQMEEICRWARVGSSPDVTKIAEAAADLLEMIVLEEVPDGESALEAVGKSISVLQSILRDGRDPREVVLPLQLKGQVAPRSDPRPPGTPPEAGSEAGGKGGGGPQAGVPQSPELLGDFTSEAMEHLEASDLHLLTLEKDSGNEEALNAVFRAFHTIKGNAGFLGLPEIQSLAHQAEDLLDRARKGKLALRGPALDVAFESVDAMKKMIGGLRGEGGPGARGKEELQGLLGRIESAFQGKEAPGGEVPGSAMPTTERQPAAFQGREAVKVDAERLDRLIDTIGELVIAESLVSQARELKDVASSDISRHLSQLDKITRELQELGMSLRMVPVRPTFQKMARLARDLSKKMEKPVEFATSGEETDLDKAMVDKIGDPLVHMVRNAIDHGLEDGPEERRRAGKPEAGRIRLRAFHKGGKIHIEVEDDGRGLDRDAILAKARERGLVKPGESPSDREVYNLLFLPGFSTAKKVTDISGRGVGLDVVRRNVEALRGQIEIRTQRGKGSVFSMRLPLTLAIIDGMVIRISDQRCIIPTLSISRSISPERKDLFTVLGKGEMLSVQGALIPLVRLSRLFQIDGAVEDPARGVVVLIEDDGRHAGLLVDELLGQQQIVIKTLGEVLQGIPGIAGGAILPDGQVGLILDVGGLIQLASSGGGGCPESHSRETGCSGASKESVESALATKGSAA